MFNWFKKKLKVEVEPPRKVFHYAPNDNMWGYAIQFNNWPDSVFGHFTPYVKDGDVFAQRMESGNVLLFRLKNVENVNDPRDMFFADVDLIGLASDHPEHLHERGGDMDILS